MKPRVGTFGLAIIATLGAAFAVRSGLSLRAPKIGQRVRVLICKTACMRRRAPGAEWLRRRGFVGVAKALSQYPSLFLVFFLGGGKGFPESTTGCQFLSSHLDVEFPGALLVVEIHGSAGFIQLTVSAWKAGDIRVAREVCFPPSLFRARLNARHISP